MDLKNLSAIRQNFGNVVYTQRIHEIMKELELNNTKNLKIVNIVLIALILFLLIIQSRNLDSPIWSFIGAALSISEIVLLITQLWFKPFEKAGRHKKIATDLISIREKYIGFMADIINLKIKSLAVIKKREQLIEECQRIYSYAPSTNKKAFQEAQKRLNPKGITDGENFTLSDNEIDRFLPTELRMNNLKKSGSLHKQIKLINRED